MIKFFMKFRNILILFVKDLEILITEYKLIRRCLLVLMTYMLYTLVHTSTHQYLVDGVLSGVYADIVMAYFALYSTILIFYFHTRNNEDPPENRFLEGIKEKFNSSKSLKKEKSKTDDKSVDDSEFEEHL